MLQMNFNYICILVSYVDVWTKLYLVGQGVHENVNENGSLPLHEL
ncbi:hypothetical protein KL86DYS1_31553 [uncultured Dysgonomonas sp.]|uniref:Uncharacterized protein n=1 Tax=uncultured Dysgonomonas sp. TaxID=206096 RepID=A0A212K5P3_9BACT|nr:hypothetical protein KL86DYS1_31553 [uncultured Dysgonomonas sp.]